MEFQNYICLAIKFILLNFNTVLTNGVQIVTQFSVHQEITCTVATKVNELIHLHTMIVPVDIR